MGEIIPHEDKAPINLGNAFDLMRPLTERSEALYAILALAADLTVERDELGDGAAYADPEFRAQEVRRRTLKGIEDLRQIANMLELRWAIENGHETWVDSDGAETSLLEVIESQMPDEEQRKSSGRARQVWSFLDTAQAFREQGFSDREIAGCAKSGLSSALGITAAAQRKLAQGRPSDELHDVYQELIEAATSTTTLDALKRKVRTLIDPTDTPPQPIPYSIENNGSHCWIVAHPTQEQWLEIMYCRLKDVLEPDNQLPEWFVRFWSSVPVGQEKG